MLSDFVRTRVREARFAARVSRRFGASFLGVRRQFARIAREARRERRTPETERGLRPFSFLGWTIHAWRAAELQYLLEEIFEAEEYACDPGRPDPWILDCGSNIGVALLYFRTRFPQARIVAFEPDPACFQALERNVEANGLTGVELHNAAVGGEAGTLRFYQDASRPGSLQGSISRERAREGRPVEVPARTLSPFLEEHPGAVVKMDIEGSEVAVLRELAASGALSRAGPLLVEYHHNADVTAGTLPGFLRTLEEAGFRYTIRGQPPGSASPESFQDLFIHARRTPDRP